MAFTPEKTVYPIEKVKEWAQNNEHIPNSEIEKDIADTQAEIVTMTAEAEHFESTPLSVATARLDRLRGGARRSGIAARMIFVEKLQAILDYRKGIYGNEKED